MWLDQQLRGDLPTRLNLGLNQLQSERQEGTNQTDARPMMKKPQNQTDLSLRRLNIVQVDRPLIGQKVEDI